MSPDRPAAVVVLAAGEGTRMKSRSRRCCTRSADAPWSTTRSPRPRRLDPAHLVVVVGHGREQVIAHLAEVGPEGCVPRCRSSSAAPATRSQCALAELPDLTGTVRRDLRRRPAADRRDAARPVAAHAEQGNAVTVLTAQLDDPTGYGRVLRGADGSVRRPIVEQKDATPEQQRAIREINSGVYAFDAAALRDGLAPARRPTTPQGELYLTDVVGHRARRRQPGRRPRGRGHRAGRGRQRPRPARRPRTASSTGAPSRPGCAPVSPCSTRPRPGSTSTCTLEPDVAARAQHPAARHAPRRTGATVGPNCLLVDTEVGRGRRASATPPRTARRSAPEASVGPYTYLRPGTRLGRGREGRRLRRDEGGRASATAPRCRTCPTSAMRPSARAPTSAPARSSPTTTASRSTAPSVGAHSLRGQRLGPGRSGEHRATAPTSRRAR